jgi:glycosyltransferase involved in cell wall biosynthesis
MTMQLSVIIPIKDERDNIAQLYRKLADTAHALNVQCEFVFVDDGSNDGSWHVLTDLAVQDDRLRAIRFHRSYGQSAALRAGIDCSSGTILVTMDGDLQYDPADIPLLLDTLAKGHDAVLGLRARRCDRFLLRTLPSLVANWLIRTVTGVNVKDMGCTFRAMPRQIAEMLPLYGQTHRFVPLLLHDCGATMVQITVRHYPRQAGRSKYGLSRVLPVLLDLTTLTFLATYRMRPMHLFGSAGLIIMALAGLLELFLTADMKLLICISLLLSGLHFIAFGLLGELVIRTRYGTPGNLVYTIRSRVNLS